MDPTDLCTIPAGMSPDGTYNFVDPPTLGPAVVAVGVVLGVISTIFTAGRLYVNRNKLHSADYFTLFACLTNIAYTGTISAGYSRYRHSWDIPVCWYTGDVLKLPFVQTVLFAPAFFFPKAAIFLLYRQLFVIQRGTKIAINVGLLITLLTYLSNIPLAAVYAAPRPGQPWESLLVSLQANARPFALAGAVQSAVGTLLDLYIFFLPMPILLRLRMPFRRRLQLAAIFSIALLGVGASIASLVVKVQVLSSSDSSWLAGVTSLASLIETNIAIIVGCAPAFAQFAIVTIGTSTFFKSLRSRLLGSRGQSSKLRSSGDGGSGGQAKTPPLVTFGGNQTPRRKNYFELSDTALLRSQGDTIAGNPAEEVEEVEMQSKPNSSRREEA